MNYKLNTPDPLETMTKGECLKIFNLLRGLSPRQWRFLRDYPRDCTRDGPAAARDTRGAFTQIFLDAGMLSNAHPPPQLTPQLTPLGQIARGEIGRAEHYVAGWLASIGELGGDVRAD